ncbi:hypothetical protein CBL_08199 [Carabus blaptoides fortunei]
MNPDAKEYSSHHSKRRVYTDEITGKVQTTSNLRRMQQTGQLTKRYPIKFRSFLESASAKVLLGPEPSRLLLGNWPGPRGGQDKICEANENTLEVLIRISLLFDEGSTLSPGLAMSVFSDDVVTTNPSPIHIHHGIHNARPNSLQTWTMLTRKLELSERTVSSSNRYNIGTGGVSFADNKKKTTVIQRKMGDQKEVSDRGGSFEQQASGPLSYKASKARESIPAGYGIVILVRPHMKKPRTVPGPKYRSQINIK